MAYISPNFAAMFRENCALQLIPAFYDCTLEWDETFTQDPNGLPGEGTITHNGGCFVTHKGKRRAFHFEECTSENIMRWLNGRKAWKRDAAWDALIEEFKK